MGERASKLSALFFLCARHGRRLFEVKVFYRPDMGKLSGKWTVRLL